MFFIACASALGATPYYHGGVIPKAKPQQGDKSILYKEYRRIMKLERTYIQEYIKFYKLKKVEKTP